MNMVQLGSVNVSIDTRTLMPGDVFFAIKGERDDGHNHLESAFAKGASAAVIKNGFLPPSVLPSNRLHFVDDTIIALQSYAKQHLDKMSAYRIALTGSSGKTTTKELIKCALAACLGEDAVIANKGNYNNLIGVPLSALRVQKHHKAAIFELGMNHFGEIATLTRFICPQSALITNIGSAHSGNLGGVDGVAKAKSELFENLGRDAIAIVNVDDPRCVREAAQKVHGNRINFGKAQWAEVRIIDVEAVGTSAVKVVCSFKGQEVRVNVPLPGVHNALNAAAALAVAVSLGLDIQLAAAGIEKMQPIKGRLVQHTLESGAIVIDDTYNANPESMEAGLNVLANFADAKRRVAVLGQMGELGDNALPMHRSIGALIAHKKIDMLFACNPNGIGYVEGAITEGFDKSRVVWSETSEDLAKKVASFLQTGDVVLVKGSRSTQMEKVVDRLIGR